MKPAVKGMTPEEQLAAMRAGNKNQELKLKLGQFEVPCRILSADEETGMIANARMSVLIPQGQDRKLAESLSVMKAVLKAATLVESTPFIGDSLLKQMSSAEITALYDQYQTKIHAIDPEFEQLTEEQIAEMIKTVKKKDASAKDYYTWQLAEIGRFFLDRILPGVSEAGS